MPVLVSGPPGSGRSSFIRSGSLASLLGAPQLREERPVAAYRPDRHRCTEALTFDLLEGVTPDDRVRPPRWGTLTANDADVIVLVTPKTELLERIQWAPHGPPGGWAVPAVPVPAPEGDDGDHARPPAARRDLVGTLGRLDLEALLRAWLHEVRRAGLRWHLVRASGGTFEPIGMDDLAPTVHAEVTASRTAWTRQEIIDVLDTRKLGYHRVDLPYGLHTAGSPRHEIASLALGDDLRGQSVLDVGCGFGALCFEAEQRGAARVVGADIKPIRLRGARTLAEILSSGVELIRRDVFEDTPDEPFDTVLTLNVLHHTADPVGSLRRVAQLARRRLVVEVPTVDDARWFDAYTLGKKRYESFLFDEGSLREALESLGFASVSLHPSALEGRAVAVCERHDSARDPASVAARSSPRPDPAAADAEADADPVGAAGVR